MEAGGRYDRTALVAPDVLGGVEVIPRVLYGFVGEYVIVERLGDEPGLVICGTGRLSTGEERDMLGADGVIRGAERVTLGAERVIWGALRLIAGRLGVDGEKERFVRERLDALLGREGLTRGALCAGLDLATLRDDAVARPRATDPRAANARSTAAARNTTPTATTRSFLGFKCECMTGALGRYPMKSSPRGHAAKISTG